MALPIQRLNERFEGEFEFKRRIFKVPFTLPGDLVQFQLRYKGPKHERFKVLHIERAESYPDDVQLATPECPYHGRCGGCRAQHLKYDYQFRLKSEPVLARMRSEYDIEPELVPAPATRAYRNRMDFVVNGADCGLRPIGDFASFVDIEACGIQRDSANQALQLCRSLLAKHPAAAYQRADHSGSLKYITIRAGSGGGLIVLTVHAPARAAADYLAFRDALTAAIRDAALPDYSLLETYTDTVEAEVSNPPGAQVLVGQDFFHEELGGLRFRVPADAFFQPNPPAFDALLERCYPWLDAELNEAQTAGELVDLYSGAGVLSAILAKRYAKHFSRVRGYESTASAIERAPVNFADAGLPDVELDFQVVDLLAPPADFLNRPARLVVLDPPRAGLSPAVREALVREQPAPALLYISCNPDSQLRDLAELKDAYVPRKAALADCFPHTPHLEQAVWLERRN